MQTEQFLPILTAEGAGLAWWQMALRAALIYVVTIVVVRLGHKRVFGRNTAMDIVLGVILGSVMSRAVNGGATFLPTVAAAGALVGLHYLSGHIAVMWDRFGPMVKGHARLLVKDGEPMNEAMRRCAIGKRDMEEAARVVGKVRDCSQIEEAWLERSGNISVIPKSAPPRVVEVKVESGVQTVRLELH